MRLILAEKFSQAKAIASYLETVHGLKYTLDETGCSFILGGHDVVVAADGHLFEDWQPEDYDAAYKDWDNESILPIIPKEWQRRRKSGDRATKTFLTLERYLPICESVIHACDTDPEGQLIGDEILQRLKNLKPVQRLPIVAYSHASIARAFADLRPNTEFRSLALAAIMRSRGDWLWGKNGSRKYAIVAKRAGYREKEGISIGRVVSPTLYMLAKHEQKILNFSPVSYYDIEAIIDIDGGEQVFADYQPPLDADASQGFDPDGLLVIESKAKAIVDGINHAKKFALTDVSHEETEEQPPLPLSLAPLQVECGKRLKYSPKQVADAAQSLYATHGLISYPRGNNRYYPTAYLPIARDTLAAIAQNLPALKVMALNADPNLHSRAFDDKKIDSTVAAHHAIMPTEAVLDFDKLTVIERGVYEVICRIYIAQFYPPAKIEKRRLEFMADKHMLVSHCSSTLNAGWHPVMDITHRGAGMALDGLDVKTPVRLCKAMETRKQTKSPRRMRDYNLISAMNNPAEFVDDPDLKLKIGSKGRLGSEATQTEMIEKLIKKKYMTRGENGTLTVTPLGMSIAKALPAELAGPALTVQWERELAMIAAGKGSAKTFMMEQESTVHDVVRREVQMHFDKSWDPKAPPGDTAGGATRPVAQPREPRPVRGAA